MAFHSLTHVMHDLEIAYLSIQVPMWVGMFQGRAPWSKWLLSPLGVPPLWIVVGITMTLIQLVLPFGRDSVLALCVGLCLSVATGYGAGRLIAARARLRPLDTEYRRGAVICDAGATRSPTRTRRLFGERDRATRADTAVTLAGIPVAPEDETKHFKLIGTTGTGKSTAIREILNCALRRGDRAVIADPDGGYLGRFRDVDRGDVILNPFDPETVKWSLFGEITTGYDIDQLARSLIPDHRGDADRIWSGYARTFFSAVTRQAQAAHMDDVELYRLLTSASARELKIMLAGTPAGPFLEDGNERMFGSIRSVTSSALEPLNHCIHQQQGQPFSVRHWVRQSARGERSSGVLFLPYKAAEIAALRSLISAWMRIAIFEAMSQPEGDQRLWFVIDELDALGEIDGLKDALARLRKFGGRTVLGFQSIAQVSATYGRGVADTIVENCGNTLILRCSAGEQGGTSEFASKLIGQREVTHLTQSKTRQTTHLLASSITTGTQVRIEPAILPSEIERLADLHGYLKLASIPDWLRVKLTGEPLGAAAKPAR